MNRLWIREKLVKYSKITVWVDVSGNDIVADVGINAFYRVPSIFYYLTPKEARRYSLMRLVHFLPSVYIYNSITTKNCGCSSGASPGAVRGARVLGGRVSVTFA